MIKDVIIHYTDVDGEVPWVGKRPGARRKSDPDEGVRRLISMRILPSTLKKLQAEAKRRGLSIGKIIDQIVDEWRKEK